MKKLLSLICACLLAVTMSAATTKTFTFGTTVPSGWTVNSSNTAASGYLKLSTGNTVTGTKAAIFGEDIPDNTGISVEVSVGTFGTWKGTKSVTVTVDVLNSTGTVLTTANSTFSSLTSSESAYKAAIKVATPTIPSNIASIRVTYSGFNSADILRAKNIRITYTPGSAAPTYTVTARSNNESLGTVSGTTTITASPKTCVGYASPAYTVSGGTATVAQSGNTFTVSNMSANVTVTINFAEQANDTYLDNVQGTDMTGNYCGSYSAPVIADKTVVSAASQTGDCATDHYHFVGWVKRSITIGEKTEPGDIIKAGTPMTADGSTYRAVWAKEAK